MKTIFSFLLLSTSVVAQCFGTLPPGVAGSPLPGRCHNIPGGSGPGPWMSPSLAVSSSVPTLLSFAWSNLPLTGTSPASFAGLISISLAPRATPFALPSGCLSGWVDPAILFSPILFNFAGCQSAPTLQVPALAGFAGVTLYSQGFLYDSIAVAWGSSNVSVMTIQ